MISLDSRKEHILKSIVTSHVSTGRPVGSGAVASELDENLSSATIRHVMHELEDLGLIGQPHTSAGRVPTEIGYRYYVDHLMSESHVAPFMESVVAREFRAHQNSVDEIIERTSRILSDLSIQAGFISFPKIKSLIFKRIEFTNLEGSTYLVTLIAGNGFIQNRVLDMGEKIPTAEFSRISNFLNRELNGQYFDDALGVLEESEKVASGAIKLIVSRARGLMREILPKIEMQRVFVEGSRHVLEQPEFQDVDKLRRLYRAFENQDVFSGFVEENSDAVGVQVRIGSEHHRPEVCDCSIVTSNYKIRNRNVGALGVLGPTRMPYEQMVSLVDFVSRRLGESLENW